MMDVEMETDAGPGDSEEQLAVNHTLLLGVDDELDSGDIENLKYLCQDVVPLSKLQKIDRGIDLFEQLENVGKISPKKRDWEFLVEILFRARRLDLVKKLGKNAKEVKRKYGGGDLATRTNLLPFRNLLYEIIEDITEEEFNTAMFVLKANFGRGKMSRITSMMELFAFLEKQGDLEVEDVGVLYKILHVLDRPDLKDKVREYEKYPYKKGRPNRVIPSVQTVQPTPYIQPATTTPGGDVDMLDTTQNQAGQGSGPELHLQAPPVIHPETGKSISDNQLLHISTELTKTKNWRLLFDKLEMTIDEMDEIAGDAEDDASKLLRVLTYWRDYVVPNDPKAGQKLFHYCLVVGLNEEASHLAMNNRFPGLDIIPHDTEDAMEATVNLTQIPNVIPNPDPTLARPAPSVPQNTPAQNQAPRNQVPVVPMPAAQNQQQANTENLAVNTGSAQVSMINPGQATDGQRRQDLLQQSGQSATANTGFMPGAEEPTRPPVNQSEEQRQENELVNTVRRGLHLDTEIDLPSYKMDAKPRGLCIVINNEKFFKIPNDDASREMPNRLGTNRDAEKLRYQFQKLDFIVQVYDNQSDVDMVQLLSGVGFRDHNQYDCFVCCILTHGATAHVFGSNGKTVRIDILTSFFRAQVCPSLAGKPKLFFIQACQGRDKQGGLDIETDTAVVPSVPRRNEQEDLATDPSGREMIPDEADFILGYATVPGYVSYRSRSQGSWYINKLVDMLDKYAYRYDLMSILVKVNEEVGSAIANVEGGRYKQIPAPLVTLRKKLYFK